MIHGRDLAQSMGRAWPIAVDDARLIIGGMAPVLPLFVNQAAASRLTATYDIRLHGGPQFVARLTQGTLTVEPAEGQSVDCHILAEPVAFLLVAYGRIGQWGPMLQGKLLAWGKKPWLGLKFKGRSLVPRQTHCEEEGRAKHWLSLPETMNRSRTEERCYLAGLI